MNPFQTLLEYFPHTSTAHSSL